MSQFDEAFDRRGDPLPPPHPAAPAIDAAQDWAPVASDGAAVVPPSALIPPAELPKWVARNRNPGSPSRRRGVRVAVLAALVVLGGLAGAVALFRASPDERADHLRKYAALCLAGGREAEAESLTRRLISERPDDVGALTILGEVLLRTGRADEGERMLESALTIDPARERAAVILASRHLMRGDAARAAACLDAVYSGPGASADVELVRADLALARGRFADAIGALARAVDARPSDAATSLRAAYTAEFVGRRVRSASFSATAADLFRRALTAADERTDPAAAVVRASALLALGRAEEARTALEALAPSDASAPLRAAILSRLGRDAEAAEVLTGQGSAGRSAATAAALASHLAARGAIEEALPILDAAAKAFPHAPQLGFVRRRLGEAAVLGRTPDDLVAAVLSTTATAFNPIEAMLAERAVASASDSAARLVRVSETGITLLDAVRSGETALARISEFEADVGATGPAGAAVPPKASGAASEAAFVPAVLAWRAALELRRGKPVEAATLLDLVEAASAGYARALVLRAAVRLETGRPREALDDVRAALARGIRSPASTAVELRALAAAGSTRETLDRARDALLEWPDDLAVAAAARHVFGEPSPGDDPHVAADRAIVEARLALARGDLAGALGVAAVLAEAKSDDAAAAVAAAAWDRAAARLLAASRAKPGDPGITATRAACLIRAGRPEAAAEALRDLMRLRSDPVASLVLQRILAARGDFAGARDTGTAPVASADARPETELSLAGVDAAEGRPVEAATRLRRLVSREVPVPVAVAAARALLDLSIAPADVDLVEKWLAASPDAGDPKDPRVAALVGSCLLARGDVEGALAVAARIRAKHPRSAEGVRLEVLAQVRGGRLDDAERSLRAAVAALPGDAVVAGLHARVQFLRGKAALEVRDVAAGAAALAEAVSGDGTDFLPLLLLAAAHSELRDPKARAAASVALANRDPRSPAEPLLAGYFESAEGRPAAALDHFVRALARSPGHPAALAALVDAALRLERVPVAEAACRDFAARGDPTGLADVLLGRCLEFRGDVAGAVAIWTAALARHPGDVAAVTFLSRSLARQRRGGEVTALVAAGADLFAAFDERGVQALRVLVAEGSAGGAGDRLVQRVLTISSPGTARGWADLIAGRALSVAGDSAGALRLLDAAARTLPGEVAVSMELLRVFGRLGRLDDADAWFARAAGEHPRESAPHCLRGMIAEFRGDFPAAEKHYRRAVELRTDIVIAANNLAWMLGERLGRVPEGLAVAREAKSIAPADADVADTHGWLVFLSQADPVWALRDLEAAVAARPSSANFRFHLAEVLRSLGMHARARNAYREVERLDAAYAKSKGVAARLAALPEQ